MYSTSEALKIIKKHEDIEAICVEGENEFGSCEGFIMHYLNGELLMEEPDDWDYIGYGCNEESVPKNFKWMIQIP